MRYRHSCWETVTAKLPKTPRLLSCQEKPESSPKHLANAAPPPLSQQHAEMRQHADSTSLHIRNQVDRQLLNTYSIGQ